MEDLSSFIQQSYGNGIGPTVPGNVLLPLYGHLQQKLGIKFRQGQQDAVEHGLQQILDATDVSTVRTSYFVRADTPNAGWERTEETPEKILHLHLTAEDESLSIVDRFREYTRPEKVGGSENRLASIDAVTGIENSNYYRKCALDHTGSGLLVIALNRNVYAQNRGTGKVVRKKVRATVAIGDDAGLFKIGTFRPVGVILHAGSETGGHYTAHVESGGVWFGTSDTAVHRAAAKFWLDADFQSGTVAVVYDRSVCENRTVVKGITNLGNTCYLSSTLQVLIHSPSFAVAIRKNSMERGDHEPI